MTTIGVIGAGHIGRSFSLAAIANGFFAAQRTVLQKKASSPRVKP